MARSNLEPYVNGDTQPDPDSLSLAAQLSAVLNGQKGDPLVASFRASLETSPAGSLAAAEDQFRRDVERGNQTPSTTDDWSNA